MRDVSTALDMTDRQFLESKTPPHRISLPKDNYENKIIYLPVRVARNDPRMEPIANNRAGSKCALYDCRASHDTGDFCDARSLTFGDAEHGLR